MTRHTADLPEKFELKVLTKKEYAAREKRHTRQREKWGFCDEDCWDLFHVIANFILPRLIRFRKMSLISYPSNLSIKRWECILDKMIAAFKILAKDDIESPQEGRIIKRGLKLFAEWFQHLWD